MKKLLLAVGMAATLLLSGCDNGHGEHHHIVFVPVHFFHWGHR